MHVLNTEYRQILNHFCVVENEVAEVYLFCVYMLLG